MQMQTLTQQKVMTTLIKYISLIVDKLVERFTSIRPHERFREALWLILTVIIYMCAATAIIYFLTLLMMHLPLFAALLILILVPTIVVVFSALYISNRNYKLHDKE